MELSCCSLQVKSSSCHLGCQWRGSQEQQQLGRNRACFTSVLVIHVPDSLVAFLTHLNAGVREDVFTRIHDYLQCLKSGTTYNCRTPSETLTGHLIIEHHQNFDLNHSAQIYLGNEFLGVQVFGHIQDMNLVSMRQYKHPTNSS